MSTNIATRPDTVTREGVTITVVTFTHDDWTRSYHVDIRDADGGCACVPSWRCPNKATARRYANAAVRAVAAGARTALAVRDTATATVRGS